MTLPAMTGGPTLGSETWISILIVGGLLLLSGMRHSLNKGGLFGAAGLGLIVGLLGNWAWLTLIIAFLISSDLLTKVAIEKKKLAHVAESEDGQRGWENVLANGGIPGMLAIAAWASSDWTSIWPLFVAAVAAAAADTWASEVGCLDKRVWMITSLRRCEVGDNGGFSITGQIAAAGGAAIIIGIASILTKISSGGWGDFETWALIGLCGWLGCQIDSILGSLFENRGLINKGTVNVLAIAASAVIAALLIL